MTYSHRGRCDASRDAATRPLPNKSGSAHVRVPRIKKPAAGRLRVFRFFRSLTMTYSHMGRPHTTIGDTSFHF